MCSFYLPPRWYDMSPQSLQSLFYELLLLRIQIYGPTYAHSKSITICCTLIYFTKTSLVTSFTFCSLMCSGHHVPRVSPAVLQVRQPLFFFQRAKTILTDGARQHCAGFNCGMNSHCWLCWNYDILVFSRVAPHESVGWRWRRRGRKVFQTFSVSVDTKYRAFIQHIHRLVSGNRYIWHCLS